MSELDNEVLKEFISTNEDKIKKIFKYSTWSYYKVPRIQTRQFSSLIKNLYKHEKYTIHSKQVIKKNNDGIKYSTVQLTLYKPGTII